MINVWDSHCSVAFLHSISSITVRSGGFKMLLQLLGGAYVRGFSEEGRPGGVARWLHSPFI